MLVVRPASICEFFFLEDFLRYGSWTRQMKLAYHVMVSIDRGVEMHEINGGVESPCDMGGFFRKFRWKFGP